MLGRMGLALAVSLAVAGCGSNLKQIKYKTYKPLNVQKGSDASTPVTLKLLFLKSDGKFKDKTFEDLWEDPKKHLEDDYVGMETFTVEALTDRETAQVRLREFAEVKPEVRFIGLIGNFSRADAGPRHVVVDAERAKSIVFHISGYQIEMRPE